MLLLAVEPSLPLMAVGTIVGAAIGGTISGTLAVVAFLRRQQKNATSIAALALIVTGGDDPDSRSKSHVVKLQRTEEWKLHSDRIHFAVKKSLPEDHPIHHLWPD